jgi:hypothetical protein
MYRQKRRKESCKAERGDRVLEEEQRSKGREREREGKPLTAY